MSWDVPDFGLEPPDYQEPRMWCDRCAEWEECPCGCGHGWCSEAREFTKPDPCEECLAFDGEPPEMDDDPRIDMLREEGTCNGM